VTELLRENDGSSIGL